jgi:hypothetical protein
VISVEIERDDQQRISLDCLTSLKNGTRLRRSSEIFSILYCWERVLIVIKRHHVDTSVHTILR